MSLIINNMIMRKLDFALGLLMVIVAVLFSACEQPDVTDNGGGDGTDKDTTGGTGSEIVYMEVSPVLQQCYYNGDYQKNGSYNFIPTFIGGDIVAGATGYEGGDGYIFYIDINSASDANMKPQSGTYTIDDARDAGTCTPGGSMDAGVMVLLEGCCGLVRENEQIVDTFYFTSGTVKIDGDTYIMTLNSEELSEPFYLKNTLPVSFRDLRQ